MNVTFSLWFFWIEALVFSISILLCLRRRKSRRKNCDLNLFTKLLMLCVAIAAGASINETQQFSSRVTGREYPRKERSGTTSPPNLAFKTIARCRPSGSKSSNHDDSLQST